MFAGGTEHLDGALAHAVAPAVRGGRDAGDISQWYFTRWVDQRGPHLRLALSGRGSDRLAEEIGAALQNATGKDRVRDSVLPPPVSRRRGGEHVGVQPVEHRSERERFGAGLADAEALFEVSSDAVTQALPSLPRGRERVAFGLGLMIALSELGIAREQRPGFWDTVAVRATGSSESGRKVLDRLAAHAQQLGPELVAIARDLRGPGTVGTALENYAQAFDQALARAESAAARAELVRHHAHLTSNRLGVNPLEELLLASVLAGGLDRPKATTSAPPPDEAAAASGEARAARDEPATEEALRVEELSKEQDGHPVLDDVSLVVRRGEVFGLVGPGGAGKSSLLGVAAGLRMASAGVVRVLGADPLADRRELADDIGVALPDEELAPTRSVRENLELRAPASAARADDVLDAIGLRGRSAVAVDDLERGERRRVALGCALMSEPEILFLDEPTADLSAVEREDVWVALRGLRAAGTTVILATTSLQEMLSVCDRAALMLAGRLVDVAEPADLAEQHFSPRSLHFCTVGEPDLALLEELPEVTGVEVEQRADHYALEIGTLQPDELLRVLGNDPDFPEIVSVTHEDLDSTFYSHAQAAGGDSTPGG